jgi:hypothetical protein
MQNAAPGAAAWRRAIKPHYTQVETQVFTDCDASGDQQCWWRQLTHAPRNGGQAQGVLSVAAHRSSLAASRCTHHRKPFRFISAKLRASGLDLDARARAARRLNAHQIKIFA